MREVALSAGGASSFGAFLAWIAKDYFTGVSSGPDSWESLAAQTLSVANSDYHIHWPSLGLGVVLGFSLWPVLEFLYLLKQYITLWLRLHCQNLLRGNRGELLYRKV